MRWRPFTWLLLSVFCFVAAAFFWGLGDEWAAKKAAQPPPQATNQSQSPKPRSGTRVPAASTHLLAQPGSLNVPSAKSAASTTNSARAARFADRLSNTTKSLKQLTHSDNAIILGNALIDTEKPVDLSIPDHLRSLGDPGSYIVQSRTPLDDAFRALLKQAGAEIVWYIPNNAYLVAASAGVAKTLAADPRTQTVLPYEPYYKLPSSLLKMAISQTPLSEDTSLNLLLFPGAHERTLSELQALGAEVIQDDRSSFGPLVTVRLGAGANVLPALARVTGIQVIELARVRVPANDLSRAVVGVSPTSISTNNYLDLTGSNVLVNVNDTGIDRTHPDFASVGGRVIGNSAGSLTDTDGHGTHVAGIIAGSGAFSTNVSSASGSIMPAVGFQFRGKAPSAKLFSMAFDPANGPFLSDIYLQETAARTNAFISNNSWNYGGSEGQTYDLAAASFDSAVRDALPRITGSQPVLFVFSAGNSGAGGDSGDGGGDDTIQSPATAKNVITVGAIEQPRNITNSFTTDCVTTNINGTNSFTICTTNSPWATLTDSGDQVAFYSSRGNVGVGVEGESGRFKPDVVAPGSFIISTRSSKWDEAAYYTRRDVLIFRDVVVQPNDLLTTTIFIPDNATDLGFKVFTNASSSNPFPGVPIFVGINDFPTATNFDFVGTNQLIISQPALTPRDQLWYFGVGNNSTQELHFDLQVAIGFTNENDTSYFQTLSNLNNSLETNGTAHYYRYESGTSMAAGEASGVLALMQDFLQNRLGHVNASGVFTNSPALMKAMLINGARSVGSQYDFQTTNTINWQGWGLINVSNSLHGGLMTPAAPTNSMFLFDQSPGAALATDQSHTWNFQVSEDGQGQALRFTLVWTDPPGNPVAGTKLVNDLDLIVTNLDNGDVFFGNDIAPGNDFNEPWDTNGPPALDVINNVENIFLSPPVGTRYSVTVVGHRVNVNAVTAHTNNIAQDYALVVSSGEGAVTNALTLSGEVVSATSIPLVTVVTNTFGADNPGTFGSILVQQHVGANSPLLATNQIPYATDANAVITLGTNIQWHFYTIANTTDFTNAAFTIFAPPNLSLPVMGAREGEEGTNSSRIEADIDLYVSRDPNLLNLRPVSVLLALKSVSRGGTESIVISNAVTGTYYIGVKSEDQRSAEYSLATIFSQLPFDQSDANGNLTLRGIPGPAHIPDGKPNKPGSVTILAFASNPTLLLHRVIVTNVISHQLMGDLFGALSHQGDHNTAVLNNHTIDSAVTNAAFIYDDGPEKNVLGAQHTDGPGSLHDFAGKRSGQLWQFTMVDNAENHLGTNQSLTIFLEKQQDLTNGITTTIEPGACRQDFLFVPPDAVKLTVTVGVLSGLGPLSFIVCPVDPAAGPCRTNLIVTGGGVITIDRNDVPPLTSGEYYVQICNLGSGPVTVHIVADIEVGVGVPVLRVFNITNPVPILDDAVITITNSVTNHFQISSLDVGLLIRHARASDLAITLISPTGLRILLFEDRGAFSPAGIGSFSSNTNDLGLPVFAVTNMLAFYTNDFEESPVGLYRPGAIFQGWNVLSNSVSIVRDLTDLCLDNNVLVLGTGAVSNTLPTTNSTSYKLSFNVTHSPYVIGMVTWWPLDDDAMDIFGGMDGILCGDPQFVSGEVDNCFLGDGAATSMMVPRCPALNLGIRPGFTIEGWINPVNVTNASPILEWNDLTSLNTPPFGVQFWLAGGFSGTNTPGSLSANLWDTTSQPHVIETPLTVVTNSAVTNGTAWQHVALTYDAATLTARMFVNGSLVLTQLVSTTNFTPRTSGDVYLGYHADATVSSTVSFRGGLDEFSLYERALCDCEIAAIAGAGSRGKYGTNVLICPVTTSVQIAGAPPITFVNGTNWFASGPQWENNVIEFTNPLLYPGTNSIATNLASIVISPVGCPGAALDEFVLSSLITNYFDGLLHFMDDTNLAPVPIKFAPAPYTVSNFPPTLVFSNGFENARLGVQTVGSVLVGSSNNAAAGQRNWTVVGSPVTVLTNFINESASSNVVALAVGAVECALPTIPGHRYELTYSVRGPCSVGWWNGDINPLNQRAQDLIGGNDGAFINGATNSSLRFVGPDSLFLGGMLAKGDSGVPDLATKIELGDPVSLRFTNSFSIEGWIRPIAQTNSFITGQIAGGDEENVIEQIFFRGDSRSCLDPYWFALEQSGPSTFGLLLHVEGANNGDCGLTIEAEDVLNAGQWAHVVGVFENNVQWTNNAPWPTNQLRLYVNGQRLTNVIIHPFFEGTQSDGFTGRSPFGNLDPAYSPGVTIGNRSRNQASEPFRGYIDELTAYGRALTDPEIAAISAAGRAGKFDPTVPPASSLAKVSAQIDGDQKDVGHGDNSSWTPHTFTFTALRANQVLRLQSLVPGSQVDAITLSEVPADLSYQPEEPLAQLNGLDAFGDWRLEIWDNRAGATNNDPALLAWQLAFHLLPEIPPPVITLEHCAPYTNTLPPSGIQYFVVNVPNWATAATNVLAYANQRFTTNPAPATVLFNQTNFPSLGDLPLIAWPATNSGLMTINPASVPQLLPAQTYYLAVTNPNPTALDFSIEVCFDISPLDNCQSVFRLARTAGIPRYFQFDLPTNAVPPGYPPLEATVWLTGANSDMTMVLSQGLPLPDLSHYDYISARPCLDDQVFVVLTNSTPFPVQTNRWYVGVFNSAPNAVPFNITVCYSTNYPAIIPLTNSVPYVADPTNQFVAPPGPPRWFFFEFSITNIVDAMLFELYGLSGDADLVLQRDVPPGQWPYFAESFLPGTSPEQIVVRASFENPDLRGNWFLGIYNNENVNVAYTIRATTPDTNGMLISALPLTYIRSPLLPPHGDLLQWNSVIGETYAIQTSPSGSPPWTNLAVLVATTACSTYELPAGFADPVQVVQIPPVTASLPTLKVAIVPPGQLRLSWLTRYFGFTLQSAPSVSGPWTFVGQPVTIIGNEFVVLDPISLTPRFYRLIK